MKDDVLDHLCGLVGRLGRGVSSRRFHVEAELWNTRDDLGARFAPRLAKLIVRVVFTCFFIVGFLHALVVPLPPQHAVASIAVMLALLCIQLLHVGRHGWRLRQSRLGYGLLLVQALLVFPPALILDNQWVGLPHFLAGSTLLILRPGWNWVGFGVVVLAVGAVEVQLVGDHEPLVYAIPYAIISAIITGLVVYGLTTLASVVRAMDAARTEMAKMAVAAERLRFSRDLHDLLGYSLSAISLKSELTYRLVNKNPERAQEELTQIIEVSRQALADVRSVASGYRDLSLDEEAISARSVLSAAVVDVNMDIDHRDLPARVSTVLATVLREGVTNILRHSKAEHCDIILRQNSDDATIEITNDGVTEAPTDRPVDSGSGIQNLSNRVASLDGTLTAAIEPDGCFKLRATIPIKRPDREPANAR